MNHPHPTFEQHNKVLARQCQALQEECQRQAEELKALKEQVATGTTWTVMEDRVFNGQEVTSWKSDKGDWAFGYGIELKGVLAMETIVTGFNSQDEAFIAAEAHCFEAMRESALGDDGL